MTTGYGPWGEVKRRTKSGTKRGRLIRALRQTRPKLFSHMVLILFASGIKLTLSTRGDENVTSNCRKKKKKGKKLRGSECD